MWQVLERWTQPGERVLDPFCGSGTTLDVCKDTGRVGVGFDLAPTRDDIDKADARRLPLEDKSVDHAFLDPPYVDNLSYSDDPRCIGKLPADGGAWREAMGQVFAELARVVRPGGVVAVYVQDTVRKLGPDRFWFQSLGIEVANLGSAHFRLIDHVAVVRGNARLDDPGAHRKAAAGALMRGFNHLLVFEVTGAASRPPSGGRAPAASGLRGPSEADKRERPRKTTAKRKRRRS